MITRTHATLLAALLLLFGNAGTASAQIIFDVTVTTPAAAAAATQPGSIIFGLFNSFAPATPTVTASLSNFTISGAGAFGAVIPPLVGNASGSAPGGITLDNGGSQNVASLQQAYSFGNTGDTLTFQVAFSGTDATGPGSGGGNFTTFALDFVANNGTDTMPGFNPNPGEGNGGNELEFQFNGDGTSQITYIDNQTGPPPNVDFEPQQVPEPSSLALCGMVAAGGFGYWRRRKQQRVEPVEAAA